MFSSTPSACPRSCAVQDTRKLPAQTPRCTALKSGGIAGTLLDVAMISCDQKKRGGDGVTFAEQSAAVSVSQALERIRQTFAVVTRGKSRMRESCTYGSA